MLLPLANHGKASSFWGEPLRPPFQRKGRSTDEIGCSKRVLLAAASVMAMAPFAANAWTLNFTPGSYNVNEAAGTVSVFVTLASEQIDTGGCTISGSVASSGGSASAGSDYTISGGTFSFAAPFLDGLPSSQIATITINVNDDAIVEGTETAGLAIQNVTEDCASDSVTAGAPANVSIADNDTAPPPTPNPTPNLTLDPNFTPNQLSIYEGLLSACATATGELLQRCQEITNADLDAIIPDEVAAQGTTAVDFGFKQFSIIHGRIVNLRNSQQQNTTLLGYSTVNINGESIPVGKALASLGSALGGAAGDDQADGPLRDSPLGFFLKGQFNVGEKDRTINEQGFQVDRKAVTFGVDYSFTDDLVLGAAFGYGGADTQYNRGNGKMENDAFEFSSYGSYFLPQSYYIDWIMSYALHKFDINRQIQFSSLDTAAKSQTDGDQYGISLGFGKDISVQDFVINPYLRLEYLKTEIDAYQETGGAGLAMAFDKQSIDSATSTIGGQISRAISMPWGILSPGARFEWVHQYMDDSRLIQARFSQASDGTGRFAVLTDNPDRDYFNLGGSLALNLQEGRAGFLRYEYRAGQATISDHTVELGARIPF